MRILAKSGQFQMVGRLPPPLRLVSRSVLSAGGRRTERSARGFGSLRTPLNRRRVRPPADRSANGLCERNLVLIGHLRLPTVVAGRNAHGNGIIPTAQTLVPLVPRYRL